MDINPLWFLSSDDKEKTKEKTAMSSTPPAKDTSSDASGKTCQFEGEDKVYKWGDGKKLPKNTSIQCGECNQYLFKDKEGCVPYMFDPVQNVYEDKSFCQLHPSKDCVEPKDQKLKTFCDINDPKNTQKKNCIPLTGVCTADAKAPKQICPF